MEKRCPFHVLFRVRLPPPPPPQSSTTLNLRDDNCLVDYYSLTEVLADSRAAVHEHEPRTTPCTNNKSTNISKVQDREQNWRRRRRKNEEKNRLFNDFAIWRNSRGLLLLVDVFCWPFARPDSLSSTHKYSSRFSFSFFLFIYLFPAHMRKKFFNETGYLFLF